MVVDVSQSTIATFEKIKLLAEAEYIKHFDVNYKQLPKIAKTINLQDKAIAMNNRAALMPIKILSHSFD